MGEKTDDRTPRAVQACHELLAWLIPLLGQFPRSRRFTLGESSRLDNRPDRFPKSLSHPRRRAGAQVGFPAHRAPAK